MARPVGPLLKAVKRGGVGIAYAVRSYALNGAHYVDCELPGVGASWKLCPVVGGDNKVINAPQDEWDGTLDPEIHPLVAIGFRGPKQPPLVFDIITNPDIDLTDTEEDAADDGENTGSANLTVRDRVIENGGTKVVISNDGSLTMYLANKLMFALQEANSLSVSKGGDSSAKLATAGDTSEQLNTIISALNALTNYVQLYVTTAIAPAGGGPVTHGATGLPDQLDTTTDGDLAVSGIAVPAREV